MMYEKTIQILIKELSKLPEIGPKSAQRLAFYILESNVEDINNLINSIKNAKVKIKFCDLCANFSENIICNICKFSGRNRKIICIVQQLRDFFSLEKAGFLGLYHILGGSINPITGIGPEKIEISMKKLKKRLLDSHEVEEILLATNPDPEGEITATFILKFLKSLSLKNIKYTKLASGLPFGSNLEFVDEISLRNSLNNRFNIPL